MTFLTSKTDEPRKPKNTRRIQLMNITDPNESVLYSHIPEGNRPYSQNELRDLHTDFFVNEMNLSLTDRASHSKCGHEYYVKNFGTKYKQMRETQQTRDVGKCSVCWKQRNYPRSLKEPLAFIVNAYQDRLKKTSTFSERGRSRDFNTYDFPALGQSPVRNVSPGAEFDHDEVSVKPGHLTYFDMHVEHIFYLWLYAETFVAPEYE